MYSRQKKKKKEYKFGGFKYIELATNARFSYHLKTLFKNMEKLCLHAFKTRSESDTKYHWEKEKIDISVSIFSNISL